MDRGAWWATVHGVAKIQTRLSDLHFTQARICREMIVFQQTVLRQIGSYLSRYTSNYISHPILKNWFNMNHRPKYKMQNYKISRREHKRKFAYFVRQKYVRPYDLWRKKLTSSKSKTFAFPKIRLKEWGREIENKVSAMNLLHYY